MKSRFLCLFFLFFSFGALAKEKEPICLIWQAPKGAMCETDWLTKEVLKGIECCEIEDGQYTVFKDRSIVVVSRGKGKKYCKELLKKHYRFVLIELGDELYAAKPKFYSKIPLVLRNYWHKRYGKNVLAFPLGYMRGFWNHQPPPPLAKASERKYTWSFAGQVNKSTRLAMVEQMKKIPNYWVRSTESFQDPQGLPIDRYRALLLETLFVPCPRGFWNLDSFRVYEALECGCIPIVENTPLDYFTRFLGPHPFLAVSSWEEAVPLIQDLLSDPKRLEERRTACHAWWLRYKQAMQEQIASSIHRALD